MALEVVLR